MKLINQFTFWYLIVASLALGIGGFIIYKNVGREIDKEQARELKDWVDDVAAKIKKGTPIRKLNKPPVEVKILSDNAPLIPFTVSDTIAIHHKLQRPERHLKGTVSYRINNMHYRISCFDIMVETDDIVDAVRTSLVWIVAILIALLIISARLISKNILKPFHQTLASIQSFRLNQSSELELPTSGTTEFANLKEFLRIMTEKAKSDYHALKEFSENASHEMQTPLAIIRGKLELLMQTGIDNTQAKHIQSALDAVEKLSRTGQALTLLTKLGNQEFQSKDNVNFSSLLRNKLDIFEDLAALKSIQLGTAIDKNILIQINPLLAEVLLNNLLSNAIQHNHEGGTVQVALTSQKLVIQNTGHKPSKPTMELFGRFAKGNPSSDSVGLGLSIVSQICSLHGQTIAYQYNNGWHNIEISW